jgi:hypothetical protein
MTTVQSVTGLSKPRLPYAAGIFGFNLVLARFRRIGQVAALRYDAHQGPACSGIEHSLTVRPAHVVGVDDAACGAYRQTPEVLECENNDEVSSRCANTLTAVI